MSVWSFPSRNKSGRGPGPSGEGTAARNASGGGVGSPRAAVAGDPISVALEKYPAVRAQRDDNVPAMFTRVTVEGQVGVQENLNESIVESRRGGAVEQESGQTRVPAQIVATRSSCGYPYRGRTPTGAAGRRKRVLDLDHRLRTRELPE